MTVIGLLRRLGPADLRNVIRDPLLVWALTLPLAVALLLRWGVPALTERLWLRYAFDVTPYYPLVIGAYVMVAPSVVGFIVGFLLLDERDDRIIDALRVTPVSMTGILAYRLSVPLLLGSVVTIAGYAIVGLVALPVPSLVMSAALAAGTATILALFLGAFADNKVSGLALAKLFTAASNFALIAWFVPMPWQLAAGITPSYWPMEVIWQSAAGTAWIGYALAGVIVNGVATMLLLRRFQRILAQ